MFKHSTKVPRLYKVAAKVAREVKEGIGSVKNLVYESKKKHPNIKAIYALVTTLFQKQDEIETLLKKSQFLIKEPRADPWLTKILLIELLWGKKRLSGDSIPEKTIQAYEQIFKAHLPNTSIISKETDIQGDTKPRYVRINTLFISLDEAVEGFRNEGWELCKFFDKTDYKGFLQKIASLSENEFLIDIHVPNLLIFPPKTEFYNHPAYQNGSIILQDKASCLPVHILNPSPGSVVLDMCAAPGMKTTQLAAVMTNQGTIYAVERNPKRFETLNRIVDSSKATCIKTENKDVLTCFAGDFKGVQYILVDPSCSGSGMTDRPEYEQQANKERIEKLAGFQIKILRSALTRYPEAKRVVYSTCSIYPEENEDVVRQVLETNTTFKLVPAKQFVNDTWENVGSSEYGEIGKYCLYAKPNEDLTNGFFVAVFERLEKDEVNKFFNTKVYNYKRHVQSQENRKKRRQEANEGFGGQHYDYSNKTMIKNENCEVDIQINEEICEEERFAYANDNQEMFFPALKNEDLEEEEEEEGGKVEENVAVKKKKKKRHACVNDNVLEETGNFDAGDSAKNIIHVKEEKEFNEVAKKVKQKKKKEVKYGELLSDEEIVQESNDIVNICENLGNFSSDIQGYMKPVKCKKEKKDISNELLVTNYSKKEQISNRMNVDGDTENSVGRESKKKKIKSEEREIEHDVDSSVASSKHQINKEDLPPNELTVGFKKKRKRASVDVSVTDEIENSVEGKRRKKKRKHSEDVTEYNLETELVTHKKGKKKNTSSECLITKVNSDVIECIDVSCDMQKISGRSFKHKNKTLNEEDIEATIKNKKNKSREPQIPKDSPITDSNCGFLLEETFEVVKKKKKKKKVE